MSFFLNIYFVFWNLWIELMHFFHYVFLIGTTNMWIIRIIIVVIIILWNISIWCLSHISVTIFYMIIIIARTVA